MVHEYQLIEVEEAHSIKKRLDALDDAYYIDRSVIAPNRGLNGEVGAYHSIGDKSLPKDLLEDLRKIAPKKDLPWTKKDKDRNLEIYLKNPQNIEYQKIIL